jgi:hypothetical protein
MSKSMSNMNLNDQIEDDEFECKELKIVTTRESNPKKSPSCKYRIISNGFNPFELFKLNQNNIIVLKTNSNITISKSQKAAASSHNHDPCPDSLLVFEVMHFIRFKALNTREEPADTIKQGYALLSKSPHALGLINNKETLTRNILTIRKKKEEFKQDAKDLEGIIIPETLSLKFTLNDKPFIIFNDMVKIPIDKKQKKFKESRIIILGCDQNIDFLNTCSVWAVDGTFNCAPESFYQLFTINGLKDNRCVPCIYALLCDKLTSSYEFVLDQVKNKITNKPHAILTDFEKAIINAVENVFSESIIHGCYFHLTSNILSFLKVKAHLFGHLTNNKDQVGVSYRRIKALPFLPLEDVICGFNMVKENSSDVFNPVMEYFEHFYIGDLVKKGGEELRKILFFRINYWNCYDRVLDGFSRSNNHIEAWHKQFNGGIRDHPTLNQLISHIRIAQTSAEKEMENVRTAEPKKIRTQEVRKNERILSIVKSYKTDFGRQRLLQYLDSIMIASEKKESHNVNYNTIEEEE